MARVSCARLALRAAWACLVLVLGAAAGCKGSHEAASVPPKIPTVRLYFLSSPAGALEPCGCVKDMLGGADHLAAYLKSQTDDAPNSALLASGPLFFMNNELVSDRQTQDAWKADALARSLGAAGLRAWAPGANDWTAGADTFAALAKAADATPLSANLRSRGLQSLRVLSIAGKKLGVVGISLPSYRGKLPDGVTTLDTLAELRRAKRDLDAQGAQIRVLLAAMGRGEALRLIDQVPGFQVLAIGKPFDEGDANDPPTPPAIVGRTLVVEAPNHLQALAVVDLFVQGDGFDFADGSNIGLIADRDSKQRRISELEKRLAAAGNTGAISAADLAARRADLARLQAEQKALVALPAPTQGSFFQYHAVEVRERLGVEPTVNAFIGGYYQRVNDHNREVFQDKRPPPAPPGSSHYVGVEVCRKCHESERAFWNGTQHAAAYSTLSFQHKQFNLDCVSCHVTGYDKPGGSTVVHVEKLENVQCEVCHGPGSRHADTPLADKLVSIPEQSFCAATCHHPPHVNDDWTAAVAWPKIVGPGHQRTKP